MLEVLPREKQGLQEEGVGGGERRLGGKGGDHGGEAEVESRVSAR